MYVYTVRRARRPPPPPIGIIHPNPPTYTHIHTHYTSTPPVLIELDLLSVALDERAFERLKGRLEMPGSGGLVLWQDFWQVGAWVGRETGGGVFGFVVGSLVGRLAVPSRIVPRVCFPHTPWHIHPQHTHTRTLAPNRPSPSS